MVAQLPENDELSISKAQLLARMDVAMGGRVAEELVFGSDNITTGASSDFNQANAIARAMVTQYGMSEKVGPLLVNPEDIDSLSPATKDLIDSEIKRLLDASRMRALKILTDHRHDLDKLAEALIEYETLSREEILRILSLPKHSPIDHLF
jgi:ATP-dependent metalloprotease